MLEETLVGIAAADGIAVGPAFLFIPPNLTVPVRHPDNPAAELARFSAAIYQATNELETLAERVRRHTNAETAAIFDAHTMMLADPMLASTVEKHVSTGKLIEEAVVETTQELAAIFRNMSDEYFAARAADIEDVGRRLLRILLGVADSSLAALDQPSVIVAHDLTPSDTAALSRDFTLGFCTAVGGLTSHTAILARTLGIPAVVGLGYAAISEIPSGAMLALTGTEGQVILNPSQRTIDRFKATQADRQEWFVAVQASSHKPAQTADGKLIEVAANIGGVKSAIEAVEFGAEGVGLLRTEFLYLEDTSAPSEAHQIEIYRAIFEAMGQRPVIVRTLDIGGDKPAPYINFPSEMNPFLGWRAIRICLDDQPLFKTQLRAILIAANGYNAKIMFPMISGVTELRAANAIVAEVRAELAAEGQPFAQDVPVGIMVETAAAAVIADFLADECDFFSIGTNDLTQYALAVDRTNERVAKLYKPLHPSVLRLIKQTIDNAHLKNKWVGMCGELAGMKRAIPILMGMGLDEFSMVPRAIPEAKYLISRIHTHEAAEIAAHALTLATASDVEHYMSTVLRDMDIPI